MARVATYVLTQTLRRRRRYPLVLMLEPLFRCNLACVGCGKIQHPQDVLRRNLSPDDCFRAVEECGAPIVSIPGGEPLLHPQIDQIVAGLVARRKYTYLCTNALKLVESLDQFSPSKYLSFSVHLDGAPRASRLGRLARRGFRSGHRGDSPGDCRRLSRDHQYHVVRRSGHRSVTRSVR